MLMSIICAPGLDLLARYGQRLVVLVAENELGEFG
jgi:hypothetical protein